jgi:chromosome partitioning protein
LVAATTALIVTEPSAPALRGVGDLLETIDVVTRRYAPTLALAGVVTNKVVATNEAAARIEELRGVFGERLWEPFVPQRTAVSEALGAHVPVTALPGDGARTVSAVFAALAEKVRPQERSMENA